MSLSSGRRCAMMKPSGVGPADGPPKKGTLHLARHGYPENIIELCGRLAQIRGKRSLKLFGKQVGFSSETVRRYLAGQRPSSEFLMKVCSTQDISALWLLSGKGPMKQSEVAKYYLTLVNEVDLCCELGTRIKSAKAGKIREPGVNGRAREAVIVNIPQSEQSSGDQKAEPSYTLLNDPTKVPLDSTQAAQGRCYKPTEAEQHRSV